MKICPRLSSLQLSELQERKSSTEDVTELKKIQAILLLDENEGVDKITLITGLKRSRIFGLRSSYFKLGLKAVTGRKRRVFQLLTGKQIKEVKDILINKTPQDFEYNSPFWSTSILADLIWIKFRVKYKSKTSYYVIFKKMKFTFHKPGRIYERRDEKEVLDWKIKAKEIVGKVWNDDSWIILASDEMILSTQTTFQKIWLPKGKYPKVEISNTRKNKSIYGFLNIKTGKEHAFLADWQNMYITRKMLTKIRQIYPKNDNKINKVKGKKILLLWDNPGWHRGSKVTDYIKKDRKIKLLYFPRYSPEENPQEHVWKQGRDKISNNKYIPNLEETAKDFTSYLNTHYFNYKLLDFSPI